MVTEGYNIETQRISVVLKKGRTRRTGSWGELCNFLDDAETEAGISISAYPGHVMHGF